MEEHVTSADRNIFSVSLSARFSDKQDWQGTGKGDKSEVFWLRNNSSLGGKKAKSQFTERQVEH
ncbi:hypothetical protein EK904_006383 [Melospiza melodia maxima]|nr:hypothetical protein EK904_006383 [Melospiza melodia maxima]